MHDGRLHIYKKQHINIIICFISKQPQNHMFYLPLKLRQKQMKEAINCTFWCNSKGNEPVSPEQWWVDDIDFNISESIRTTKG